MRVLRILASRRLDCGCLLGIYETYAGCIAGIIDDQDPACPYVIHHVGRVVQQGTQGTGSSDPGAGSGKTLTTS